MKKTTKTLAISLVALSLLVLSACSPNQVADNSGGQLTVIANNIDLEEIPIMGGHVNADFTIRNDSAEPVAILSGETSCMCTEAVIKGKDGFESNKIVMSGHNGSNRLINYNVQPGETITVTAIFDPLAHGPNGTGPIMRDVYLRTNSTVSPKMKLTFQGNVIKQL